MNNPTDVGDEFGEWFEVYNNSESDINLNGLDVYDGENDSFVVVENLVIPVGEQFVFIVNGDTMVNGNIAGNFTYTGFVLSNSSDEIILSHNGRVIDEVMYSSDLGYTLSAGKSISLSVDKYTFADNDIAESWCPAPTQYGTNDYGTPSVMNPQCPVVEDLDGDGFDNTYDCDDGDALVNPVAEEIWYDGVDQNCDGKSDYDQDSDGSDSVLYAGTDCDDLNELINENAYDLPANGVDEDCDGTDAPNTGVSSVLDLFEGDLVVTEVMYNPAAVSDSDGEWFEIFVAYPETVNLGGLAICDNQGCIAVSSSLEVNSESYVLIGTNGDSSLNGGVTLNYDYANGLGGFGNSGDFIELQYNGIIFDFFDYSVGFPTANGASLSLNTSIFSTTDNDDASNWCLSSSTFGLGDLGTPGMSNDSCN